MARNETHFKRKHEGHNKSTHGKIALGNRINGTHHNPMPRFHALIGFAPSQHWEFQFEFCTGKKRVGLRGEWRATACEGFGSNC